MATGTPAAVVEYAQQVTWGRKTKAGAATNIAALGLVLLSPMLVLMNWAALSRYEGSLSLALAAARSEGYITFAAHNLPSPTLVGALSYVVWISWQAALYSYLPGTLCFGQRTPGGHLLSYTANGLIAWILTIAVYLTASGLGLIDPAFIAKNWGPIFLAANAYGFIVSILAQYKGHTSPSFAADRKITGSWIFDFWSGVELNPRLGKTWDVKFFHNGRPGMIAWVLVDLSWAAYQQQNIGYVTKSMQVAILLHTLYVVDFFFNESWYTRTIDISHDHFGFMLAWGDSTFLPTFYTLQTQYLALYPNQLTQAQSVGILALGLFGYMIFRCSNFERDNFRAQNGNITTWGKAARYIHCKYRTQDGKEHSSLLLTSGWWGLSRHTNYFGDLILSWAMCATCGFGNLLPWSYFIFMFVLLNHRAKRDEKRCHNKYGKQWEEYCKAVPYRLLPGFY